MTLEMHSCIEYDVTPNECVIDTKNYRHMMENGARILAESGASYIGFVLGEDSLKLHPKLFLDEKAFKPREAAYTLQPAELIVHADATAHFLWRLKDSGDYCESVHFDVEKSSR